ncbi:radical SAM protein [Isoalcanivorax indicus]|uniref:radical SAM protein n=1 Tax=Isoalcanivorax indicus TaxID=2202653 RepID=UPI000DB9B69B|nr:radical SAM protein [Isoalcanivorax indicus]
MQLIKTQDWYRTAQDEPRGYIESSALREVWFHTGTACNLACPFCLEGSKPGDDRLGLMTLADVRPLIDEACELGVEQFSFTGGEPFVARQFPDILAYAAARRPCLVLTNGTRPLLQRLAQIEPLATAAHPVAFRISIDYPDLARHEAGRGAGTFDESFRALKALHDLGFQVSLARQWAPDENTAEVEGAYRAWFRQYGLPETLHLVSFPDFAPPGAARETPEITEHCMTTYQNAESRARFMCAFSRMVVKDKGRMRVYACTLVDDDSRYDLGSTLRESLGQRIMMRHHRCFSCFSLGSSCSELGA